MDPTALISNVEFFHLFVNTAREYQRPEGNLTMAMYVVRLMEGRIVEDYLAIQIGHHTRLKSFQLTFLFRFV